MNSLISLENIEKTYTTGETFFKALDNINLEINNGEFVAIMGSSGSGKSTLMNIIGCLDKPSAGNYLFRGENILNKTKKELAFIRRNNIGFVFQSFNLLPRTSAWENVAIPLMYHKNITRVETQKRVNESLALVHLTEKKSSYPNQLSGGQQQRVAIARALVNDPKLILADEPTGNLDTKNSIEIMELFASLNLKGKTIIVITHEIEIAKFCKRKILIRDGKIIEDSKSA